MGQRGFLSIETEFKAGISHLTFPYQLAKNLFLLQLGMNTMWLFDRRIY
jgi:hypothetical protein